MESNFGSGLYGVSVECLIAGLPAFNATFDDGLDEASAPSEDSVLPFIEVCALCIACLLSGAPLLTEATLKEMLPSNGVLLFDGSLDGDV